MLNYNDYYDNEEKIRRKLNRMIVNLTKEQIKQIINMIENASFKGSSAEEVGNLLKTLKLAKIEGTNEEPINSNS